MRLAKLHINGFKSFPDRAELGFDDGVTAIVGPNGCGKSNVVDAITWVLGEQSAKSLRGERMEDVIFNGSDARKPTGTAEVRLKLTSVAQAAVVAMPPASDPVGEMLDGLPLITRDIEIGRRLYRSGESEYLIDGEVCRLRDVHDLLMDSGLGVKAYAVIEQGKIGQILSSRPAERRALIEEAAGVTKYKARRRTAELKLEAAQQNLTRVDDIVFEVEKQRGALRRQAARARRYKRLREELRRWEQVQVARRHEALSRDIETADARLADIRAREAAAAARLAELEAELEALRLALTESEAGATAAREAAHARELEYGRRQQQVQFETQQTGELAAQAQALSAELADLEARRAPARDAVSTQREAAAAVRLALDEASASVEAREADYRQALGDVQRAEQESDATRARVMAGTSTLSALGQARDHASAALQRIAAERERLDLEARELHAELASVSAARDANARGLAQAETDRHVADLDRQRAEQTLADARAERRRVEDAIGAGQRGLAGAEARLRSLQELDASRATFGDAARFLLASHEVSALGALADHLVVGRSYERAVDALLGDLLQHVVVARANDAASALQLLEERDVGRCGFLVVEDAGASPDAEPAGRTPSGATRIEDVVRATGPYAAAINRVIGRALIAESFETARALAGTAGVPVATMAGEVFRQGGLVEGGSRQGARGILETRAEIASLTERVDQMAANLARLTGESAGLDAALVAAEAALAAAVARRHDGEKAIVALEAARQGFSDDAGRLGNRRDLVAAERERTGEEERAAEDRRQEAVAAIAMHEAQQAEAQGRLGGVAASLQAARDAAEARLRLASEARTAQATLAERLTGLDHEVRRLEEAERDLDARVGQRQGDLSRAETRRTGLIDSVGRTERQLDDDVRAIEALRKGLRDLDEQAAALRGEFNLGDQRIRGARHDLEKVRADVLQSELARASAASDVSHLAAICLETFGVSIDDVVLAVERMEEAGELAAPATRIAAASTPEESEEEEAGETEAAAGAADAPQITPDADDAGPLLGPEDVILSLKRKIERLGAVNMMAIEQFDELEARHTFLTTQRKDLLDSIAQTGEAIRKIDKTTRERFDEAFHSINTHFAQTFTTLFGGGRAGLVLIDQENDAESGIDIIAQPPGKRLQSVQLLSGGEKALTAMALMFAVFKHRPSPFCLLDEIDAPLDDANIGRFVEMLQGMQGHTQFILITHNRKTMEIADRLYGVTMEEPGVSKLISVQLN